MRAREKRERDGKRKGVGALGRTLHRAALHRATPRYTALHCLLCLVRMQRKVFELSQDQYTKAGGKVTALTCAGGKEGQVHQLVAGLASGHVEEYHFDINGTNENANANAGGSFSSPSITSTSSSSSSSSSTLRLPNVALFREFVVSKKPIDQLCVVPDTSAAAGNILCALSGNQLYVVREWEREQKVTRVKVNALKGVFFLAQDLCNVGCRNLLAVCRTSLAPGLQKKLKLVFLEVGSGAEFASSGGSGNSSGSGGLQVLHEQVLDSKEAAVFTSSSSVKEVVWYGDSILLRTDKKYVHLSLSTQVVKEIFSHNNSPRDKATSSSFFKQDTGGDSSEVCTHQYMIPIPEKKLTLLLTEDIGTIVNMMGEPTGSMVQFPAEPMALHAMSYPYLLAVFAKSVYVYDIRKDLRDAHVQTILFNNYFLSPNKADQVPVTSWTSVSHTGENQIYIIVGHDDMLLFLSQAPLEEQCKEMLRAEKFQECLQVAYTSKLPEYRQYLIENLCAEAAFHLMGKGEFHEALQYLVKCEEFQPSQLFPLFPEYTKHWKTKVERKRYWSMHPPLISLKELMESVAEESGLTTSSTVASIKGEICDYLLENRQKEGILLADGVDTLLVHLLLDIDEIEKLEEFARLPNHISIQDVEGRLCEIGRVHTLALLYESLEQFHSAAELWISLCENKRSELPNPGAFLTREMNQEGKTLMTIIPVEVARVLKKAGSASSAINEFLPWLMENAVDVSLKLLSDVSLTVNEIMSMLKATKSRRSRWKYLDFVVNALMSKDPMHHSEFAIAMIDLWKSEKEVGGEEIDPETLANIRSRLQSFLEDSDYYNTQTVVSALKGTALWPEQVTVNKKIGNHKEALHILTFTMKNRERAVSYCEELGTQEGYLTLLDMLLNPEEGPPLYGDAVRLLGSRGAALNPLRVLEALSDTMPMPLAYETLARMLRERAHRKRSGQIVKGLARAHELSIAQDRVLALSEHIEMTADRACRVCHVRLGTKVFGLYPNGVLVCYRCMMRNGKDAQHVCPVTGTDFSKTFM